VETSAGLHVEAWCRRLLGLVDEAQPAGERQREGLQALAEDRILGVWLRGGRGVAGIDGGTRRSHVAGIDGGAQRSHVAGGRG
jgi:hypothetical protein